MAIETKYLFALDTNVLSVILLSLSFIYSSFHMSVFSLLHAMAVVLHADETVRGTTAGSHFSGNF